MSLLGFLFERNKEQSDSDAEVSQPVESGSVSEFVGDESVLGEPNIDQIREELAEIAKLIGPGDSYDMLAETDLNMTCVEITMGEIKQLASHAFCEQRISEVADDTRVTVLFSDLFDQLQSGTVEATIAQLLGEVAEEHRADNFHEIKEDKVALPLQVVVNSVRPEELSKRTTKVERDPELAGMPDVFNLPGMPNREVTPSVPANRLEAQEAPSVNERAAIPFKPSSVSSDEVLEKQEETIETAEQDLVEEPADVEAASEVNGHQPSGLKLASRDEAAAEAVEEEKRIEETPTEEAAVEAAISEEDTVEEPVTEDAAPAFEIPASIPLGAQETVDEAIEEEPAAPAFDIPAAREDVPQEPAAEAPAEAAFSGFEIPQFSPIEPVEAAEPVSAEISEGHPSLEELDRLMQQAERDATPSEYNPPGEDVSVVSAPAGGGEVLVRNLDINRASAEELVSRLDGIGPKLAVRIVQDREINGRFSDVYDLSRVQGIGAKIFESITGLPWREDLCGRREILANILDSSKDSIPDIKRVSQRVAETKGFEGCVIAHDEGHVLASSWDHEKNEALGAFAPQMFKKVVQYISRLELGEMDAFTFFFEDFPITLVRHGDIFLAAVHSPNRYSRRHVQIARTLTAELSRRLQRLREI